jgi:DnaJ-class molecular chaperone
MTTEIKKTKSIKCAFCKGHGIDPFEVMSKLATCQVCKGKKKVEIIEPFVDCKFCHGSGVYPTSRLSCTACSGKGAISVQSHNGRVCKSCNGSGIDPVRGAQFWCFECHGTGLLVEVA